MRNDRTNIIVDKTFSFALQIIEFTEKLFEQKGAFRLPIRFLNPALRLVPTCVKARTRKVTQILFTR